MLFAGMTEVFGAPIPHPEHPFHPVNHGYSCIVWQFSHPKPLPVFMSNCFMLRRLAMEGFIVFDMNSIHSGFSFISCSNPAREFGNFVSSGFGILKSPSRAPAPWHVPHFTSLNIFEPKPCMTGFIFGSTTSFIYSLRSPFDMLSQSITESAVTTVSVTTRVSVLESALAGGQECVARGAAVEKSEAIQRMVMEISVVFILIEKKIYSKPVNRSTKRGMRHLRIP